ncbi:hypothetical protein [Mycolicibacterium peregrinum]|uniref:Lipoprotein LpqS n=1 Tax=Mycolicibacterium peregrinum TaxID=43304 RepID=A0A1A0WDN4_MYCPR|nr:hypothetical protein [Mycolicibacterium peregrinum]OBB95830.1 hypothetical protein A5779_17995 [Mycolicibacterium peregrinum]
MKSLAALMAIVLWAAAFAGLAKITDHDHPAHLPHPVAAAIGFDSGELTLDHPHIGDDAPSHMPDGFTAAVLPRNYLAVAAFSMVVLIVGCAVLCGCAAVRAQRGPPDRHRIPLAGQALLLRICIARR